ncbi:hypothetical protein AB0K48_20935, partial [Nonomuraea sp. NPDC055795]
PAKAPARPAKAPARPAKAPARPAKAPARQKGEDGGTDVAALGLAGPAAPPSPAAAAPAEGAALAPGAAGTEAERAGTAAPAAASVLVRTAAAPMTVVVLGALLEGLGEVSDRLTGGALELVRVGPRAT